MKARLARTRARNSGSRSSSAQSLGSADMSREEERTSTLATAPLLPAAPAAGERRWLLLVTGRHLERRVGERLAPDVGDLLRHRLRPDEGRRADRDAAEALLFH